MFMFYMKEETSTDRAATIVWLLFSVYPPMLEGRVVLYVLVPSIAEPLGILRHMIKSPSAVAYIVSVFLFLSLFVSFLYFLCAMSVFIAVVFAHVFLFLFFLMLTNVC